MTDAEKRLESFDWNEPDDFLEMLVSIANRSGGFSDLTLIVQGLMVTGTLVSGREFTERFGDTISKAVERQFGESADDIRKIYSEMADRRYPQHEKDEEEIETSNDAPDIEPITAFIHLKDVRIVNPEWGPFVSTFPYWRIRLTSVAGWTLGRSSKSD